MKDIIKFKKDKEILVVGNCDYESFKEYILRGYEVCGDSTLQPALNYTHKHMLEMYKALKPRFESVGKLYGTEIIVDNEIEKIELPMFSDNGSLLNPNGYDNRKLISKKELKEWIKKNKFNLTADNIYTTEKDDPSQGISGKYGNIIYGNDLIEEFNL